MFQLFSAVLQLLPQKTDEQQGQMEHPKAATGGAAAIKKVFLKIRKIDMK